MKEWKQQLDILDTEKDYDVYNFDKEWYYVWCKALCT